MAALAVQQMPYGECIDGEKEEPEWEDDRRGMTTETGVGDIGHLHSQDLNISFNSFDGSVSDVSLGVIPAKNINSVLSGCIGSSAERIEFARVEDLLRSEVVDGNDSTVELTTDGDELVRLNNNISLPNPEEVKSAFDEQRQPPFLHSHDSQSFSSGCWGDSEKSTDIAHNVRPVELLHDVDSNPPAASEARSAIHPHCEHLQNTNVMGCLHYDAQSVCISEDTVEFHDESEWGSVGDDEAAAAISNEKCSNAAACAPLSSVATSVSQHPPPPPSTCFYNTSDRETMPPPQSDLVRRALNDLPQQRKHRYQGQARELKSQATKKAAFNRRAIAERLAELEKEKAAIAKELERVKSIRRSQETELSTMKHQKVSLKQWVEAEKEITNRWCAEQKSRTTKDCKQALKQAHLACARLRSGTLAMDGDKKEIERLKAELGLQRERTDELQKKNKITERRLHRKISSLEERLTESEEQVAHLERQRVELLMTGFSTKRQQRGFPSHRTTPALSPLSKGSKKGKEEDVSLCAGDDGRNIMKTKGQQNVVETIDENKAQMKNATNISSHQDDTGTMVENVAEMSIQAQSETQPQRGVSAVMCPTSAESKQDVNNESGRLATSTKFEVDHHLLLPSKQEAYVNGENCGEGPMSEKKTVSFNVDHQIESATTPILSWSPSAAYNPNRYRRISPVWGGEKIKECIPSSKETTTQEDVTLSVSAIAECNKSCERLEDGQSVVQFANGTRKETLMCGKTTFSNGHKVIEYPTGQKEEHFIDGTKKVQFADGSTARMRLDGTLDSA